MILSRTVIKENNLVFTEYIKDYEVTYKKTIGLIVNLEGADKKTRFEMYYAEDFVECYNMFSVMKMTFEDLQKQLKNEIDSRVRDRLEGRKSPAKAVINQEPEYSPEARPEAKQGNPFGAVLDNQRDTSGYSNDPPSPHMQPMKVSHSRDTQPGNPPQFGGKITTMPVSMQPISRHPQVDSRQSQSKAGSIHSNAGIDSLVDMCDTGQRKG